jgi:hypothetical protein
MLNGIKVWRLSWPIHNINSMVFKPGFGLFAGVLGVIILLEDNILVPFLKILDGLLKLII